MSRTYALALIFATVTLVSGLFYGQYWYFTSQQAEVSAYAAGVHERVVVGQQKEMRRMTVEVTKRLRDETKERFRPIQGFIFEVEEKREAYLKLSKSIKPIINDSKLLLRELALLHNSQLEWLKTRTKELLLEHGGQMDLRQEDIKVKSVYLETAINERMNTSVSIRDADLSILLNRDLLTVDYLNAVTLVLRDIFDLTGGITLNCFPPPDYFPVINHGFSDPQLGEMITTSVSVGKLDYSHKPEDMFVLINGDTLQMNNYRMEAYSFKPTRRGKQVLKMELYLRNPLTGYTHREGVNHYNYHVR